MVRVLFFSDTITRMGYFEGSRRSRHICSNAGWPAYASAVTRAHGFTLTAYSSEAQFKELAAFQSSTSVGRKLA